MKRAALILMIFSLLAPPLFSEQSIQFYGYYDADNGSSFILDVIPTVITEQGGERRTGEGGYLLIFQPD